MIPELLTAVVLAVCLYVAAAARVVKQIERGVVFRLGRLRGTRPGSDHGDALRRPDEAGEHADRDHARARPGRHHP